MANLIVTFFLMLWNLFFFFNPCMCNITLLKSLNISCGLPLIYLSLHLDKCHHVHLLSVNWTCCCLIIYCLRNFFRFHPMISVALITAGMQGQSKFRGLGTLYWLRELSIFYVEMAKSVKMFHFAFFFFVGGGRGKI